MKLTQELIIHAALDAGFMITTTCGQETGKQMPVADTETLRRFAESLLARMEGIK